MRKCCIASDEHWLDRGEEGRKEIPKTRCSCHHGLYSALQPFCCLEYRRLGFRIIVSAWSKVAGIPIDRQI